MDFPNHVLPSQEFQPYYQHIQQPDELWYPAPTLQPHPITATFAAGSPKQSAINRFLDERDGPSAWFRTPMNTVLPPFPSLDLDSPYAAYYEPQGPTYRYPSPTDSGQSSAYNCSGQGDHRNSPWSSPDLNAAPHSPESLYAGFHGCGVGFRQSHEHIGGTMNGPCVALHDVQGYPDTQPETVRLEDDANLYVEPQEGFEPMQQEPEPDSIVHNGANGIVKGDHSSHRDVTSTEMPNIRRRRPSGARSPTSPSKVTKRPSSSRRNSSFSKTNGHKHHTVCQSASNRAFPCPFAIYNCASTFGAKNEWKRHVNTQHMQIGYWRCDQCDQSDRKPNDFNRKDLFIQHVRRMHPLDVNKPPTTKSNSSRPAKNDPEEREMNCIATRCFVSMREPPKECACIVCEATFTGDSAWDDRLEHIGKHWEATKKEDDEPNEPKDWQKDHALHEFLDREGIIALEGKRWILA